MGNAHLNTTEASAAPMLTPNAPIREGNRMITKADIDRAKSIAGDKKAAAEKAEADFRDMVIAFADQEAAAMGIKPGDKVLVTWADRSLSVASKTTKSCEAFFMGHEFMSGEYLPIWKAIKKDGTPSEVRAKTPYWDAKMEPLK
jgi:hypothetical protein